MHIVILGAGVIGISTAWHLLRLGHGVTVVDRQDGAALETSFANAGQISVSYCEPWANREAPLKLLGWMFRSDAPLLFRPQADWQQWRWGLRFLAQCHDAAFARNVAQLVALGRYSQQALREVVAHTGIAYHRLQRGIAHVFTDARALEAAGQAAALMQRFGVSRRVVSRDELLAIEPALTPFAPHIAGGTYTDSDESGDAQRFAAELARHCQQAGARFLWGHDVERLAAEAGAVQPVAVRDRACGARRVLAADAVVVACGAYSAPLLRAVGVDLPIYPGKGYSASFPILRREAAPSVSFIDDANKIAVTRLGGRLRVAGTIELAGFDLALDTPVARARCAMLARRIDQLLPGVCDTRDADAGGDPRWWCGLRPATPTNIPYIGRTPVRGLWVNAGHGTLGWTHAAGSGRALAELIDGRQPDLDFGFYGHAPDHARRTAQPGDAAAARRLRPQSQG